MLLLKCVGKDMHASCFRFGSNKRYTRLLHICRNTKQIRLMRQVQCVASKVSFYTISNSYSQLSVIEGNELVCAVLPRFIYIVTTCKLAAHRTTEHISTHFSTIVHLFPFSVGNVSSGIT